MELKIDRQRTENISNFVDKQTRIHPFGDNKMAERAYRRAERLVAAMYLLTNHISPQEPIRGIIRSESANLLQQILAVRDEMRTLGSTKTYSIESSLRNLLSLVRILAISGFVSFENADILTDALDDLGAFLETSRRSTLSENIRLSREDLMSIDVVENRRDVIKDIVSIKDSQLDKNVLNKRDIPFSRRSEGILEVLRSAPDLSINDIALNLPEYGVKTIQRELVDLIESGRVRKIGFKRWSRYALVVAEQQPVSVLKGNTDETMKTL
ncbi:MAG TPA: hypothetical protein VMU27_02950 [Candidatus Paceibacterota bacterium]|nr:hypothetical protein [Candidatus Paceibacterota bacterium]